MPDDGPNGPVGLPRTDQNRWLAAILIVAMVFRIAVALQPGFNQPDEIWQYVEPAWGWATGHWVQTWEFHVGLRGWLIPMIFRPILMAGHALNSGAGNALIALRLFLALFSLVIPYTFWRLGQTISPLHGLVAGWVGAIWPELFYFASRPSAENLATIGTFAAILALYGKPKTKTHDPVGRDNMRTAWIGFCLTLCLIIRLQYAPALGLIALACVRNAPARRLPWIVLGAMAGLALGATADLLAGQQPFGWLLTNFRMNLSENRSAFFGTNPVWWYLQQIGLTWSLGTLLFIPSIVIAARRFPLLVTIALFILAAHSLIPHKEYRFILLGQVLLIFVAAIGSLDLVRAIGTRWCAGAASPKWVMNLLAAVWFVCAVLTSTTRPFVDNWGNGRAFSKALAIAGNTQGLCGLAVIHAPSHPFTSYALLGRDVPMLLIDGPQTRTTTRMNSARFNVVFAPRLVEHDLPPDYSLVDCQFPHKAAKDQYYCVFKRAGSCSGGAGDLDYNTALTRLGN